MITNRERYKNFISKWAPISARDTERFMIELNELIVASLNDSLASYRRKIEVELDRIIKEAITKCHPN